jgi:hypothetical protein
VKLTKTRTEACDYYRSESGAEYRIISTRSGDETHLRFEFLVSGHWETVEDKEIEAELLDAWAGP